VGERLGLIDLRQERLRKSDHLNPIADHDELRRVVAECGLRIERITYYTPVVGACVENILARMAERWLTRRAGGTGEKRDEALLRSARTSAQQRVRRRADTPASWFSVMWLDVILPADSIRSVFRRPQQSCAHALVLRRARPTRARHRRFCSSGGCEGLAALGHEVHVATTGRGALDGPVTWHAMGLPLDSTRCAGCGRRGDRPRTTGGADP
jgi:hypothetical protein